MPARLISTATAALPPCRRRERSAIRRDVRTVRDRVDQPSQILRAVTEVGIHEYGRLEIAVTDRRNARLERAGQPLVDGVLDNLKHVDRASQLLELGGRAVGGAVVHHDDPQRQCVSTVERGQRRDERRQIAFLVVGRKHHGHLHARASAIDPPAPRLRVNAHAVSAAADIVVV